jgi:hypothetical protein
MTTATSANLVSDFWRNSTDADFLLLQIIHDTEYLSEEIQLQ